ncbi:MAG TPA: hypothetical protein VNK91_13755 [Burkholderiaceae bacterium]|nr:hypothetical protein [Burkholderiaceae bacterium]
MTDDVERPDERRFALIRGGRADAGDTAQRLRDCASLGPRTSDLREFAQHLDTEANKAVADAERTAERMRKLSDGTDDPAELEIANTTVVVNRRVAALLKRRSDALRELLAYVEAMPPRDAIVYADVVFFIRDREQTLQEKRRQQLEARLADGEDGPRFSFADSVSLALDRIEALATDLSELDGALANCRARFGHLPAVPR